MVLTTIVSVSYKGLAGFLPNVGGLPWPPMFF